MPEEHASGVGDDDRDLARVVVELARGGRTRDLVRLLVARLGSLESVSVAAAALIEESRSRMWSIRSGPDGWGETSLSVDDPGPLAASVRSGRSMHGEDAMMWVVPLVVSGSVLGSLGIGGPGVSVGDRLRLADLALVTVLSLENTALHLSASRSVTEIATVLSSLIESRDTYTESHCVALAEMSVGVGIRMGLDSDRLTVLNLAGHLHDIGKVSVPDEVLLKQGPLSEAEFSVMKSHAMIGETVLAKISSFATVAPVVGQHHERFDGSGYPRGLSGDGILFEARVLSVVDAFDAMTTSRPYRPALTAEVAVQEILDGAGSQFDPDVAGMFLYYLEGEEAQWNHNRSP